MKKLLLVLLLSGCSFDLKEQGQESLSVLERPEFTYEESDASLINRQRNAAYCERNSETISFYYNDASVKITVPVWCDTQPYKFKGDPSPLER